MLFFLHFFVSFIHHHHHHRPCWSLSMRTRRNKWNYWERSNSKLREHVRALSCMLLLLGVVNCSSSVWDVWRRRQRVDTNAHNFTMAQQNKWVHPLEHIRVALTLSLSVFSLGHCMANDPLYFMCVCCTMHFASTVNVSRCNWHAEWVSTSPTHRYTTNKFANDAWDTVDGLRNVHSKNPKTEKARDEMVLLSFANALDDGSRLRFAQCRWHMVCTRHTRSYAAAFTLSVFKQQAAAAQCVI